MASVQKSEYELRRLENCWDWNQSAFQLGGADYDGLDMLNLQMIETRSSIVC